MSVRTRVPPPIPRVVRDRVCLASPLIKGALVGSAPSTIKSSGRIYRGVGPTMRGCGLEIAEMAWGRTYGPTADLSGFQFKFPAITRVINGDLSS